MSIGFGIFLIAAGAIVAWAIPGLWEVPGVDWSLIGTILMIAGAAVTLFGIINMARAGRTTSVTSTSVDSSGNRVERTDSTQHREQP